MSMDIISDNTSGERARCAVGRSTSDGAESAAVKSAGCIDGPRNGPGIASEGVSPCSPPTLTPSPDTLRAAFEEHRRETRETRELLERSRFSSSSKSDEHIAWLAYRAGYEHAIAKAAATVAAMTISPTDIILCADTIDEAAARIRALANWENER